ncbi:MAG: hypothetical protein HZA52_09025 [Planctomycetes bacterium]|nr:hypothetical protein [Planctomycetota bacterium]
MAAECNWNANNLAFSNTWGILLALEELRAKFSLAGAIRMDGLAFWSAAASPALRALEAQALAARMDRLFVQLLQAKYEQGKTRPQALTAVQAALLVAKGTVCELSVVVDEHYNFQGELK